MKDLLFRVDTKTVAWEAHGLEQLVQIFDQEGVVDGGCQLDVAYMAWAEVAVEAASDTTKQQSGGNV